MSLLIIAVALARTYLIRAKMFVIVENVPLTVESYHRVFSSPFMWNDFLNAPSADQGIFNFRAYIYLLGRVTHLDLTQLIWLVKVGLLAAAALGVYLNLQLLNRRYLGDKLTNYAIISGSLVYALNPSFLVGDNFWLGIQIGYYTLPLILFFAARIIIGRSVLVSSAFLLWLFPINNAAHFVFGGYQLLIAAYLAMLCAIDGAVVRNKIQTFGRICLIAACFALGEASLLLGTVKVISSLPTSMTKESIDVPWSTATLLNMTHGMSFTQIFKDFFDLHSGISNFLLNILLLIVPASIIWQLMHINDAEPSRPEQNLRRMLIFATLGYLGLLFAFATDSPVHFVRYIITMDLPLGRIFRTWRVPEAALALLTSLLFAMALTKMKISLRRSFSIARSKQIPLMLTMGALIALAFPVAINRINGPLIDVPKSYEALNKYLVSLNDHQNHAIVFSPVFTASYGVGATLKPTWSPYIGMIMEFAEYSASNAFDRPAKQPGEFLSLYFLKYIRAWHSY